MYFRLQYSPYGYSCRFIVRLLATVALLLFITAIKSEEDHSRHRLMMSTGKALKVSQARYDLPDVELVTNHGQSFDVTSSLSGDVIINFIFTSCATICPVQSATFSQLDKEMNKQGIQARLISISIDPEQDTPAQLGRYAEKFTASKQWVFVTGDKHDIILLQKAFDAFRGNKMNHEPITFIRKRKTRDWVRIEGFASTTEILHEYQKN